MPAFTVEKCEAANTFKNDFGEFQVWKLQVHDGEKSLEAELNTKLGKSGPSIGDRIEGELTKGPYGWKLKRAAQNGGGGGNSSSGGSKDSDAYRTPEQIMRSYAQSQALQYWKLKHEGDPAYVISTWGEFQAVVELFYQDVKGAS